MHIIDQSTLDWRWVRLSTGTWFSTTYILIVVYKLFFFFFLYNSSLYLKDHLVVGYIGFLIDVL